VPLLRTKEETLWLAKLDRSSHEATADGSSESISAAITKRINANTTTERSTAACREAQSYLTRKLRERDLGRDLEGAKITLNEYLDRWLETAVRPRVRLKTFQDYQGMLYRYVRPILGQRVLTGLRPLDPQTVYQQMTERGLSARTVRYAHVVVRSAMQQAVRWRLLLENPADGLKVPQQQRKEMRALTVDQARTFLKAAEGTKFGPVLAVALTTGMRPSEYLGLKWQDVDWARQTISIVRSIRRLNGKWCFSDTKAFEKPSSNQAAELDCCPSS